MLNSHHDDISTAASLQVILLGLTFLAAVTFRHWFWGVDFVYAEPYKQLWMASLITFALLLTPFMRLHSRSRESHRAWILTVPFIATLPGALLHQWQWNYNVSAEWLNTGLPFAWALLWISVWHDPREGARNTVFLLVTAAVITLGWSYVEWALVEGFLRPPATNFGNQNYAANFLILVFPFFLVLAHQRVLERRWTWLGLALATAIVLLVMLRTRAAVAGWLVASYIALGFWMKTHPTSRRIWFAWWLLPVTSIVIIILLSLFYWELAVKVRYLELVGPHAWYSRTFPWLVGWQSVLEAPWLGHGPGSSWALFNGFVDKLPETMAVATNTDYAHIHNDYLESLQEGGVLGLLAYLSAWGWITWLALRVACDPARSTMDRGLSGAAAYGLLAWHFHSLAEVAARMPVNRLALFAVGTIVLMLSSRETVPHESGSNAQKSFVWLPITGAFLALMISGAALWKEIPRQRDAFMAIRSPEIVMQDTYWQNRIDTQTDSAEALYDRIRFKLFNQGTSQGVSDLLERMNHIIPGFRQDKSLQLFRYLAEHKNGDMDPDAVGTLIRNARAGAERYYPVVEHIAAQYAARTQQPELLLEVLEDRLFREALHWRIARANHRENVLVRVDTEGSGFAMSYDNQGHLLFVMGMPQLRMLIAIASGQLPQREAAKQLATVSAKVRAQQEPTPNFMRNMEKLAQAYVEDLAILSEQPAVRGIR